MTAQSFDPALLMPAAGGISGPFGFLSLLLFVAFVLHLLLMNALVGVSCITLVSWLRALYAPKGGNTAAWEADLDLQSSLLPKGVALVVNFGIPPLLILQGLYGQFIYPSSILMGAWWLAVMPVVMLAYYGLYLNMAPRGLARRTRILALGLAFLLLLTNAFILVNNMTLMQSPQTWVAYAAKAGGTFLNLADPQLFPRYLHMMLACPAVGGLCLAVPAQLSLRALARVQAPLARQEHQHARLRLGLSWFTHATLLQFPVGAWFLLSLPKAQQLLFMGGSGAATALFCISLALTGLALFSAVKQRATHTALASLGVILCMTGMRSLLRASLIAPWYAPHMRGGETGPLLLFAVSAVFAALLVWRMIRIYRKPCPAAPLKPAAKLPEPSLPAEAAEETLYLTVNELALSAQADSQEAEDEECAQENSDLPENSPDAEACAASAAPHTAKSPEPDDTATGGTKEDA